MSLRSLGVLAMSDATWATFWSAFWPAAALVVGALGAEFRSIFQRRADEKRKQRADAITELSTVIETLRKEMEERDKRHRCDMDEIRGQHEDCEKRHDQLSSDYDDLKKDHYELKRDFAEFKKSCVAPVSTGGSQCLSPPAASKPLSAA